jgi:O-methyltransferase
VDVKTDTMMSDGTVRDYEPESLYLDLMKKILTRYGFEGVYAVPVIQYENPESVPFTPGQRIIMLGLRLLRAMMKRYGFNQVHVMLEPPQGHYEYNLEPSSYWHIRKLVALDYVRLIRRLKFDPELRLEGRDWPADAETMIGLRRLNNIQYCVEDVLRSRVPGDLIETGVWRGGATIFMRALLKAYGDTDRRVWVADSFHGLPEPDAANYPEDSQFNLSKYPELSVSLEQVKANFARYGLLDDQVRFLVGWFRDTLPSAPIERLAVLRLDGDLYESTMDALRVLYPKLSSGGYVIVDDYGAVPPCKSAVDAYRNEHAISEPLEQVDWSGVFWRKR